MTSAYSPGVIPFLLACYVVGLACELGGAIIVIRDVRADAADLKALIEQRATAVDVQGVDFGGVAVTGGFGAFGAQNAVRSDAVERFVTSRIQTGFRRRWLGIALLLGGVVIGGAANIVSLYA